MNPNIIIALCVGLAVVICAMPFWLVWMVGKVLKTTYRGNR